MLVCVARCIVETLSRLLTMHDYLAGALNIAVCNRQAIFDFRCGRLGEQLLQAIKLLEEQVAVRISRSTAVACLRQMLNALVAVALGALVGRDRMGWLAAA